MSYWLPLVHYLLYMYNIEVLFKEISQFPWLTSFWNLQIFLRRTLKRSFSAKTSFDEFFIQRTLKSDINPGFLVEHVLNTRRLIVSWCSKMPRADGKSIKISCYVRLSCPCFLEYHVTATRLALMYYTIRYEIFYFNL